MVTKDLPLRLKASIAGLDADEYRNEQVDHEDWTGFVELDGRARRSSTSCSRSASSTSTRPGTCRATPASPWPADPSRRSAGCTPTSGCTSCAATGPLFDVRGRSAEQRVALDLLADPEVGIVSLGGQAGTGKSVLALAAGLEAVLEQRAQKRVVVFRPLFAVGGQDLGYLPGDRDEKMAPWGAAVLDALDAIAGPAVVEEVLARDLLEVLPLTHIRGRSLTDTFVIIDEAQNLERPVLLTALSPPRRGQPGGADPRRRPARQPPGRPPRRRRRR